MLRKKAFGFTLIELMVTVTIVGILLFFAYPAYVDYIRKARRGEAKSVLQALQINQTKWRANHTRYVATVASVSPTGTTSVISGATNYYTLAIPAATATMFRATATPVSTTDQNKDNCGALAIDQRGPTFTGAGYTAADWKDKCWR